MTRKEIDHVKKLLLKIINQKSKVVRSYIERGLWVEGMLHMDNVLGNTYADFGVAMEEAYGLLRKAPHDAKDR